MKRTVAFILLLATVFGFCAFGGAAPSADAAPAETAEDAEVVKIKITKDNFLDYFKYTGNYKPWQSTDKNSSGKVISYTVWPAYVLKNGYRVVHDYDGNYETKIEVGVKYNVKTYYPAKKNVKIDFSKLTYKVTGKARRTEKKDEMLEGSYRYNSDDKTWDYAIIFNDMTYMTYKGKFAWAVQKKSVEIVSVKGTLYLYADSIPDSDS